MRGVETSGCFAGPGRALFPPILNPVPWKFVLRLFAAFWAAEKTDEKKPVPWPGLALGVGSSDVGVKELERTLESLLGVSTDDAEALLV